MLMQACALDVLPCALPRSVHLLVKVFRVFTSCSIGINIRFEKLNYDTVSWPTIYPALIIVCLFFAYKH